MWMLHDVCGWVTEEVGVRDNWEDKDLHEIHNSGDTDSSNKGILQCTQHLLCATNVVSEYGRVKLCAYAHTAHEVRQSTEVISWRGARGETWQDFKDSLPSKD